MIKVEPEELRSTAMHLKSESATIESHLAALRSRVDQLVGGDWEGLASTSFGHLFTQWHSSAVKLQEALDGMGSLLDRASTIYGTTDDDLSRVMQGLG